MTVGDIGHHPRPERLEEVGEQGAGAGAIDVVIGEDADRLLPLDGAGEAGHRARHVGEPVGIGEQGAELRGEHALHRILRHAAVGEHGGEQGREAAGGKRCGARPALAAEPAPPAQAEPRGGQEGAQRPLAQSPVHVLVAKL